MHFHFQLANHYFGGLYLIEDIVTPVVWGLRARGHRVTMGFLPELPPWPSVVLVMEYFELDHVTDAFLQWRNDPAERKCVGVLCTEDISDKLVMDHPDYPGRRRNLLRVLPHCDFVWPIVPSDYAAHVPPERLAFLDFGYVHALRRDGLPAGERDIDVLLYGSVNERRSRVLEGLRKKGLKVAATRGLLPDYMRDNLIGRAKVVLDVKRADDVKYTSPSRICTALQMGATLVSERFDTSRLGSLYRYTEACAFEEIVERCWALAQAPDCLERGLAARERFRQDTSMADNLGRAMNLPIFAELAAATGVR
ncbi:MAG TPA: hypothetical protein VMQ11_14805 [Alphaproteobacteria bacterium]|nr:hypothetical protein [Alphaproteobacteria bacterium]